MVIGRYLSWTAELKNGIIPDGVWPYDSSTLSIFKVFSQKTRQFGHVSLTLSGIISKLEIHYGGTSILSSKKPEFSKKDCSEISGSKYSGNQICRLRKFKYVGRYFELCSSKEKIRMYRMFLESDCSLTYCRYQLKLNYRDQLCNQPNGSFEHLRSKNFEYFSSQEKNKHHFWNALGIWSVFHGWLFFPPLQ